MSPMTSRRWLEAVGSVGVVTAGLVVADRAARRRFGRPPRRHASPQPDLIPSDALDVTMRSADGAALRGWMRASPSGQSGAAAVVIHGWGGSAVDMLPAAEWLLDLGLHVLLVDARGHGRSDDCAVASMPSFADDVRVALDWMRTAPLVDPQRIALVGHSVGAGACLFAASTDTDVAAVVSLASMADPSVFMANLLSKWLPAPMVELALRYVEQTIGHRYTEFAPVYTIGRIQAPVMLLHGQQDTTVPVTDAYQLHDRAPDNSILVVLPDADHFSVEALQSAGPDLTRFLGECGLVESGWR